MPKYSIKTMLVAVASVAALLAIGVYLVRQVRDADVRHAFGPRGLTLLRSADRVEVYRIEKPADRDKWITAGVADFTVIAGPIVITADDAEQLVEVLTNRNSYLWDVAKACTPLPGVRIDFIRGDKRLQVMVCFECGILINYLDGELVGAANFDPSYPQMLKFVRRLFPNDKAIQSLPNAL